MRGANSQTIKNDPDNKGRKFSKKLETQLRRIWLGRRSLVKTFDDDKDFDVQEVRQLLSSDDSTDSPDNTSSPEKDLA